MSSSVIPSAKYSWSRLSLRSTNGSTAAVRWRDRREGISHGDYLQKLMQIARHGHCLAERVHGPSTTCSRLLPDVSLEPAHLPSSGRTHRRAPLCTDPTMTGRRVRRPVLVGCTDCQSCACLRIGRIAMRRSRQRGWGVVAPRWRLSDAIRASATSRCILRNDSPANCACSRRPTKRNPMRNTGLGM